MVLNIEHKLVAIPERVKGNYTGALDLTIQRSSGTPKVITKNDQRLSRLWEEYASIYDALNDFYPYASLRTKIVDTVTELRTTRGKDHATIFEVGCGTGNIMKALADSHNGYSLMGIDKAEAMLKVAKEKMRPYNQGSAQFKSSCQDINDQAFWDKFTNQKNYQGKVDIVIINLVLFNIMDKETLYENLHQLLVPGGHLVVCDFLPDWNKLALILSHLKHRGVVSLMKNMAASIKINKLVKQIFADLAETYLTPEEHISLMQRTGFIPHAQENVYEGQATLTIGKKVANGN